MTTPAWYTPLTSPDYDPDSWSGSYQIQQFGVGEGFEGRPPSALTAMANPSEAMVTAEQEDNPPQNLQQQGAYREYVREDHDDSPPAGESDHVPLGVEP